MEDFRDGRVRCAARGRVAPGGWSGRVRVGDRRRDPDAALSCAAARRDHAADRVPWLPVNGIEARLETQGRFALGARRSTPDVVWPDGRERRVKS
jgi:hypothetical protein